MGTDVWEVKRLLDPLDQEKPYLASLVQATASGLKKWLNRCTLGCVGLGFFGGGEEGRVFTLLRRPF